MLLIAHYYATRSAAQSVKQLVRCRTAEEHSVRRAHLQMYKAELIHILDSSAWALESLHLSFSFSSV